MSRRFWHSLVAVLLGNAIYYGLWRYLPDQARHQPTHIDWGLAIDFWICLALYQLLAHVRWFQTKIDSRK